VNIHTAVALINLGIITLVGFVCWATKSPWPLLGLVFMCSEEQLKGSRVNVKAEEEHDDSKA